MGAQSRLQQRRRLPEDAVARLRRLPRRAGVQGVPALPPGPHARLVLRVRRADGAQHQGERADPRRAPRRAEQRRRTSLGAVPLMAPLELHDVQGLVARGYGDLKAAAFLLLSLTDGTAARRWLGEATEAVTAAAVRPDDRALQLAFT